MKWEQNGSNMGNHRKHRHVISTAAKLRMIFCFTKHLYIFLLFGYFCIIFDEFVNVNFVNCHLWGVLHYYNDVLINVKLKNDFFLKPP